MTKSKTSQPRKGATRPASPNTLVIDANYIKKGDRERFADKSDDEFNKALTARALTHPEVLAARVIQQHEGDKLNINACADELRAQIAEVNRGNMKRPEAMLVAQAHTLDALFSYLAMRSKRNSTAGYLDAADRYMRLALRAQSQTVRTIEVLNELKNPRPVAFVQQANIAAGPQQVNNGVPIPSPERENEITPTQQSGMTYELLPDARASQEASRINPALETMGKIDRAENRRG